MKVLLVDQIAKVNYKYTFPLANGLKKAGVDVLLAIDQKEEKKIVYARGLICLPRTKKKSENWRKCAIILHHIRK